MVASQAGALLADIRRASQALKRGRRADAMAIYRDVDSRAGTSVEVQFELGNLCQEIGDIDRAIAHYDLAAEGSPDDVRYLSALGIACLNGGDPQRARETLERASRLNPENPTVQHGLGVCHMRRGDYERALGYLERACELKPADAATRRNLTVALNRLNRHGEALVHARRAVQLEDASPGSHFVLAETLAEMGEIDDAVRQLEHTIRRHKSFALAYELLARLRRFSSGDAAFMSKTEKVLEQGMTPQDRSALHFALGKMHDDCGGYDAAFVHYTQGNLLQKRDYDFKSDERRLRETKKLFTVKSLQRYRSLGHPSAQPVFIIGMPRSGTTLMERMIASHPSAAGAGELAEVERLAALLFSGKGGRSNAAHAGLGLTAERTSAWAEGYLDVLRQGRGEAERIVDKMPANFAFVGLINTLFPNATVIHAVRDPLDTCLSCYFQSFTQLGWTNDLALIGKIYGLYRKTMAYWNEVLPEGTIVDVHYERLVEDPETHARRMLEACGLEWSPSVLEFFRKPGVVKTASVAQVREPIYTTSRMRWVNYASHLEPLVSALAPYLKEDRALLQEHGIELPGISGRLRQWLH